MSPPAVSSTAPGRTSWLRDSPDVVLVAAAQRGERDALNELLQRHYDKLYGVAYRLTGNAADAADATQEAMIAIARGISRFDGTSSFTTWSYRVATNATLDELRRRGRRPVPAELDGELGRVTPATPSMSGLVDASVDLGRALQHLPVEYRAPLVLRDVCGLDYAEIAEVLGIPGGTVRSRIARGRAALAPHLLVVDRSGDHPAADAVREPDHVPAASKERP